MTTQPQDSFSFDWKPLLDIGLLLIASFGLLFIFQAIPGLEENFMLAASLGPALILLTTWLILRRRGISFRQLGVRMPDNLAKAIGIGLLISLGLFIVSTATEALGLTRDLSRFDSLKDNLPFALFGVLFGFFGAGFYEEVVFRGFLSNRVAHTLGAGKRAWIIAILAQGVIFGLAHASQGIYGIFYTGLLSMGLAAIYVYGGRNLWPIIIGHGVYDSVRFVYFYYMLTYGGMETLAG